MYPCVCSTQVLAGACTCKQVQHTKNLFSLSVQWQTCKSAGSRAAYVTKIENYNITDWSPHKWCIQSNGVWLSGEWRRSIIWKGSDQFWTEEGAFEYIFHHLKRFSCFQHPWLRLGRLWPKFRHQTLSPRIYVNVHVPVCCFVTGQTCLCRITLQCTNYTYPRQRKYNRNEYSAVGSPAVRLCNRV